MQSISIAVTVPQSVAAREGLIAWGDCYVTPTAEEWSATPATVRAALVERSPSSRRLALDAAPSWPAVLAAHAALVLEQQRAARLLEEEREAQILAALESPDDAWIASGGDPIYRVDGHGELSTTRSGRVQHAPLLGECGLSPASLTDPRVVARREQIERDVLPGLVAAHLARCAEYEAGVAREIARDAELEAAELARAVVYVRANVPEFARAAAEGCDVRKQAAAHAFRTMRALAERQLRDGTIAQVVESYRDAGAQETPSSYAYEVYDRARAFGDALPADLRAVVGEIDVSIMRVDTCPESSCHSDRRTVVRIGLANLDRAIYVYADTAPQHEHGSEEDE